MNREERHKFLEEEKNEKLLAQQKLVEKVKDGV